MDSYQTKCTSCEHLLAVGTSENQTDHNTTIMRIELSNCTGTNGTCIENLNDDCLLEIFSCNSLNLIDLCSLTETCTRFKQIIQRVFAKDHPYRIGCKFPIGYKFRSRNHGTKVINLQTAERIMQHFGQYLSELSIDDNYPDIVNLIRQYCDDVILKSLKISYWKSLDDIIKPLDSTFQRVQKLTVNRCKFIEPAPWFALNCSSLTELTINYSRGCGEIMECTFPHLERFTWRFSYVYVEESIRNCDMLHKLIRRHGHLKSINICVCCNELLNVIDSHCKDLEELNLIDVIQSTLSFSTSSLGSLVKLKTLDLDFGYRNFNEQCEYIPFLEAVKSLETIKISCSHRFGVSDQIFDVLSQLKSLRELHLAHCKCNRIRWTMLSQLRKVNIKCCHTCSRETDITNIIEELVNLEELKFKRILPRNSDPEYKRSFLRSSDPLLSENDFLKICEIVERREHVLTLKSNLSLELEKYCDVNRRVKLINVCDSSDD